MKKTLAKRKILTNVFVDKEGYPIEVPKATGVFALVTENLGLYLVDDDTTTTKWSNTFVCYIDKLIKVERVIDENSLSANRFSITYKLTVKNREQIEIRTVFFNTPFEVLDFEKVLHLRIRWSDDVSKDMEMKLPFALLENYSAVWFLSKTIFYYNSSIDHGDILDYEFKSALCDFKIAPMIRISGKECTELKLDLEYASDVLYLPAMDDFERIWLAKKLKELVTIKTVNARKVIDAKQITTEPQETQKEKRVETKPQATTVGGSNKEEELDLTIVLPEFIEGVAKVRSIGNVKYGDDVWKTMDRGVFEKTLYRHWMAYLKGEKCDKESGLNHLYHVCCDAMVLTHFDEIEEQKEKK